MPPDTAVAVAEPRGLPTVRKPASEALHQLEKVVLEGNLAALNPQERVAFYARVCESLGLNPLTRPFEYITLNNKLTLYVRKDATDQLRDLHGVTIDRLERERDEAAGLAIVTAYATDRYGRTDSSIGAVSIKGLAGENLANALMKAETKAKRRVTLSICGLGWMDEIEAMDARQVEVAPRQAASSAIRSRTAALTAAAHEEERAVPDAAPTRACTHPSDRHVATEHGIVCGVDGCGVLLAEKGPGDQIQPRTRGRRTAVEPKKPGDDGYWRARAHAIADERGLDPDALKRVAGAVLGKTGEWSRTELDDQAWEYVAGVVESAPVRVEDVEAWQDAATVFAGHAALAAGVVKKLARDADWKPVEALAEGLMGTPADQLGPAEWSELGLRWHAAQGAA